MSSHLEKFARLDETLSRLDPLEDHELWIWTAMNACVHLLNATLHSAGATVETDSFHTQVEGLYAVPDRGSGTLTDALHAPGDVMHFGQPPIEAPLPESVARAGAALRLIEDLREPHVRGAEPVNASDTAVWAAAYRECVEQLMHALDRLGARR